MVKFGGFVICVVFFSGIWASLIVRGVVWRLCVCVLFYIFYLIWFIIVFGVGIVTGIVLGVGCCFVNVFCVLFKYSYSNVYYRWCVVGYGVCFGCVVFVVVLVCVRFFIISRAASSSTCLASMASSLSVVSSVGVFYV